MSCFHPLKGYRGVDGGFRYSSRHSPDQVLMTVRCGQCIGCRLDRAREWGVRIAHEASLHDESSFLTLTYSPEALPDDYSVSIRAVQLFFKRLRKAISPARVRYFVCGEYGDPERGRRPHYHAIVFGFGFPDKVVWRRSKSGHLCYRSAFLEKLWPYGSSEIGSVTRETGAYVARYCLKKVGGPPAADHYRWLHPGTGEVVELRPEFAVCSRRPGLGAGWLRRFETDAFPSAFLVLEGRRCPIPRFYSKLVSEEQRAGAAEEVAYRALARLGDCTPDRLQVREELQVMKQDRLKREREL